MSIPEFGYIWEPLKQSPESYNTVQSSSVSLPSWHLYPHFPLTKNNRSLRAYVYHFPYLITPNLHHIVTIQFLSWPLDRYHLLLLTSSGTNSLLCLPAFPAIISLTLVFQHYIITPRSILGPPWLGPELQVFTAPCTSCMCQVFQV